MHNSLVERLVSAAENFAYAYCYKTGYLQYARQEFVPEKKPTDYRFVPEKKPTDYTLEAKLSNVEESVNDLVAELIPDSMIDEYKDFMARLKEAQQSEQVR